MQGALSAALAARDRWLKAIAVPEANAREAAMLEGVKVFALKSLPQAVDLVNSPRSFTPVQVDAGQMLAEAAQYSVDLSHVVEHKRREAEIETNGFTSLIHKFQPPFQALPSTFHRPVNQLVATCSLKRSQWLGKWFAVIMGREDAFIDFMLTVV